MSRSPTANDHTADRQPCPAWPPNSVFSDLITDPDHGTEPPGAYVVIPVPVAGDDAAARSAANAYTVSSTPAPHE